jgi:hypothetical protein
MLVDRTEGGACLGAKVGQLGFECDNVCLQYRDIRLDGRNVSFDCRNVSFDRGEIKRVVSLIRAQCVDRCQNRAIVSVRSLERRDARLEIF